LGFTTFAANARRAATLSSALTAAGAFALTSGSADAAVQTDFLPGNYTIHLSGANKTNGITLGRSKM
jgi:hypothetical protein